MAKGAVAKEQIAKKMAEVFGADWIGERDKKYYLWANENGERIQIAISMTCPKTPVGEAGATADLNVLNFEDGATDGGETPIEITTDEKKNIADLKARLGLN